MPDNPPTYRFKYSNYDLNIYLRGRRAVANSLRHDAQILLKRAEQIDKEADEMEDALVPVSP